MPVDDLVRRIRDVMTRADALFGSASIEAPGARSAHPLAGAADSLRRTAAPYLAGGMASEMAGAAMSSYSALAQHRASVLARLADDEKALNSILTRAADAETAAASASRASLAAAGSASERVTSQRPPAALQRTLVAAMGSALARQQILVRQHHERAAELARQVQLLEYE